MKIHAVRQGRWKYELDFKFMGDGDDKDPAEIGKKAGAEIRLLTAKLKDEDLAHELNDIAEAFEDTVDSDDSFNSCMEELYDVADQNDLWVKTF